MGKNRASQKDWDISDRIVESNVISKTGRMEDCEDRIFVGRHFLAVIDGATSKDDLLYHGKSRGILASELIADQLGKIPGDWSLAEIVASLTERIYNFYVEEKIENSVRENPHQRISASLVIFNKQKQDVWLIGDCQVNLNGRIIVNTKIGDTILSNVRAMYLASEIQKGKTIGNLQADDTGRSFILPLLIRQSIFQNNPTAKKYSYPVVDGFPINMNDLIGAQVSDEDRWLVLASDGYPKLGKNLDESEEYLRNLMKKDPLLFQNYQSTKGLYSGNISYDDRAYVKILLK